MVTVGELVRLYGEKHYNNVWVNNQFYREKYNDIEVLSFYIDDDYDLEICVDGDELFKRERGLK